MAAEPEAQPGLDSSHNTHNILPRNPYRYETSLLTVSAYFAPACTDIAALSDIAFSRGRHVIVDPRVLLWQRLCEGGRQRQQAAQE